MRKFILVTVLILFCTASIGCTALMDSLFTDGGTAHEVVEDVAENASQSTNPLIALLGAVGVAALGYGTKKYTDKKKATTSKKGKK